MKKLIIAIVAIPLFSFSPCDETVKGNGKVTTQERTIESFSGLSTAGSIDIVLIQGSKEGISVITDENIQPYVITEVKGNTLSVHLKENTSVNTTKLTVRVTCRDLEKISAGGSGDLNTEGTLKANDLDISQGGSGDFNLNIDVSKLKIRKAGSGNFEIEGKAGTFQVSSAGSGDLHAEKLAIIDSQISMAGSGDVYLAKGTKPKVSSAGSGDVHYE